MSALRWPADSPTGALPAAPGRLRRRAEFAAVYRRGRSWSDALVALRVLPTPLPECRVGYAVGKRVGNAVVRNRVKRRLREALRRLAPRPGVDLVVIARGEAAAASYDELLASLGRLLGRARLLPGERAR